MFSSIKYLLWPNSIPKMFCNVLGFFDLVNLITFLKADLSLCGEKLVKELEELLVSWLRL